MVLTTAEIVTLIAAAIGQTGAVINLVKYLKAHPLHGFGDVLPTEHQPVFYRLVADARAFVAANEQGFGNPLLSAVAGDMGR